MAKSKKASRRVTAPSETAAARTAGARRATQRKASSAAAGETAARRRIERSEALAVRGHIQIRGKRRQATRDSKQRPAQP